MFVLLAAGGFGFWLARRPVGADKCEIRASNTKFVIQLPADTTFALSGPVGSTVVSIKDRAARVVRSDCPRKLCVRMGEITRPGQVIICVPNQVVVQLVGEELDAITR
ncbi:hypothetical protein CH330_02240 [candidate division WOR-3 bacterium JGI_Cruoil_03_51_56]|uniref:Uncharacterized protein n=1 Tax=candidate division WOR-3 bacterium JGI_Cruoil_03_51_56 TaxID=1973747 RepID=A0A235BW85_UNCW3|nr:MAG: hypothetical protein CH330_02240 [candidate division WOR-3 bacterium JGI_Cruoil_03_51_56]